MKFSEWMKLDEIQHVTLQGPMNINGITADSIDFRFEDWKKGYNPEKNGGHYSQEIARPTSSGQRFFMGSFSAQTKTGWLNVSRESRPALQGSSALATAVQPAVVIAAKPEFEPLPNIWFDFAIFYLGNHVVKSPEWPRDRWEMTPADVAVLEPVIRSE